jgi:hypothetical protein
MATNKNQPVPASTETPTEVKVPAKVQRILDRVASKEISKSEGIRQLASPTFGLKTGPIAKLLGIRYQMVRNTLVRQEAVLKARADRAAAAAAIAETETPETESDETVETETETADEAEDVQD